MTNYTDSVEKTPIFIPVQLPDISNKSVIDKDFHLLFCKLYVYDYFQNKKCVYKGLSKVWFPEDFNLKNSLYTSSITNNTEMQNLDENLIKISQQSCFQQVNSLYSGQLKKRFSGVHNFNLESENNDNSEIQIIKDNCLNTLNVDFSNENNATDITFLGKINKNQPITPNEQGDWNLTQSIIVEENHDDFINNHNTYQDRIELENFVSHMDSGIPSGKPLENECKNNSNKLDYEMLLPHSIVESSSYLSISSIQNNLNISQDQISDYDQIYGNLFENCDDPDRISEVNEEIDKKHNCGDFPYIQSCNSLNNDADETYFLTDISNSTSDIKKDKNFNFSKNLNIKCDICERKCRSFNALNHHMLVHSEERPHVCEICKKAFKEQPTLRRHMWTHMDKQHQCDICEKYFVEKSSLRRHISTIHADFKPGMKTFQHNSNLLQQYCCGKCGKVFKSHTKYNMHKDMHGNPNYECDTCGKVYAGRSHLRIHQRIHTGEKPYACNLCNMQFAFKHVLKSHQARIHQKIHKFKCNLCSLSFVKKSELSTHASCHILNLKKGKRHYSPRKTTKKYLSQDKRQASQKMATKSLGPVIPITGLFSQLIDETPEKQDKADYELKNDIILSLSIKNDSESGNDGPSGSPESPVEQGKKHKQCSHCNKAFERMGDLKRHIISHIVENINRKAREQNHSIPAYECEICYDAIFKQVDKFKKHLREHAKLTLYQCDVCDRAFGDSSNFSKHKKVHGLSYLKCTICNRKFNTKRMMVRHMEYHRHNKPKTCNYCKKLFHFESNLRKHVKIAHLAKGKMTYRCEECGDRFDSVKSKWEHQWERHKMRKVDADCYICSAQFRKISLLRAHLMKEHAAVVSSLNIRNV